MYRLYNTVYISRHYVDISRHCINMQVKKGGNLGGPTSLDQGHHLANFLLRHQSPQLYEPSTSKGLQIQCTLHDIDLGNRW